MSLLASASLILTPNGYKSGKLYSIVPSSGNGDLTFTRATSASRVNSSGLIENVLTGVPRLDYSGSNASILLEPQRTNLRLQSSDFTTSWNSNYSATVTPNTTISPDGTQNADTINPTFIAGSGIYQGTTVVSGSTYTFSVYVKNTSTATSIQIGADRDPTGGTISFNPTTGTIIGTGSAIRSSSVLNAGNGWYRVIGTYNATSASTPFVIYSSPASTSSFAAWGTQLESGSYATSYIPTTTSTVTRNADLASVSGVSSLIGQTEGVLFVESAALFNDLTSRLITISDGSTNNRIMLYYNTTSNLITVSMVSSGTTIIAGISYTLTDETQFSKIAVRYSNILGVSLWVNGVNRVSSVATTLPISTNRFAFDGGNTSTSPFYAKVKSAQLYKTYLTDAEMASLTTL